MYKYGIVVIGYKNEKGIKRLLNALSMANFCGENVKLIISIDKSDSDKVLMAANEYHWSFGEKRVNTFEKRLGLREHILHCGDYLNIYELDALAVFEDDTLPSYNFFQFMMAATEKYIENEDIAGVSLYSHGMNYNTKERFIPMANGSDNYFMQVAQSWGQVWFKKQWNDFRTWYKGQKNLENSHLVPRHVTGWPETSWLKYHIAYCIEKNKYFVYPYISYSTFFADVGEHVKTQTDDFQVPISRRLVRTQDFRLLDYSENALKYDAFFENTSIADYCSVSREKLLVDLYGDHTATDKRYVLTKKKMPYKIINSWGNKLMPHEMNVIYNFLGNEIFLYDLENEGKIVEFPKEGNKNSLKKDKMEVYFDILDHWMEMEESGKRLDEYFLKKKWEHVAIYGYGKIGKHLFRRLKNTPVCVDYFIDQNVGICEKDVVIKKLSEKLPVVDVIVVTPVMEFEKIRKCLQQNWSYEVVSIRDIWE